MVILNLVILLSCVTIAFPIWFANKNTSDVWKHVNAAQHYTGRGIPSTIKNILPEPQFSYPWFSSWLLSVTKPKQPNKLGSVINVTVLITVTVITSIVALHELDVASRQLFCAIVLCNPVWIGPWSGTYSLNTRVTGAVFTNIFVFLFCGPVLIDLKTTILLATAITCLLIFISKFAIQAILIFSLFYAVFFRDPSPLLAFVSGLIVAGIVSNGRSWDIIRGHIMHSVFYAQFAQFNTVALNVKRTSFQSLFLTALDVLAARRFNIQSLAYNAQARLFVWNPQILIIMFIAGSTLWTESTATENSLKPVAIGVALAFIIDIKGLRFLGEPDRYFYFMSLYAGAAYITTNQDIEKAIWIYVPYFVVCIAIMIYMIKARFKGETSFADESKQAGEAVQSINWVQTNKGETVLVNPSNLSDRFACISAFRYVGVHCQVSWDRATWPTYKEFFREGYPTIALSKRIKTQFNVTALIVDKNYYNGGGDVDRLLSSCNVGNAPEFENQRYAVYKVSPKLI